MIPAVDCSATSGFVDHFVYILLFVTASISALTCTGEDDLIPHQDLLAPNELSSHYCGRALDRVSSALQMSTYEHL